MTQSLDIFRQLKEYPLWCSGLRTQHCLCGGTGSIPGLVHWVKDQVLLQLAVGYKSGSDLVPGLGTCIGREVAKKKFFSFN